jgi:hypothetical protein
MDEKLVIDKSLVRELHHYISTTPTGTVPFNLVFGMLSKLEQLPPLKEAENKEAEVKGKK